ncbi:MAG: hypothetical protein DI534_14385 [Leifsonia xyli]|nr:MAG: hypothetical protein DI534_14385 [Leifsonia xyli]
MLQVTSTGTPINSPVIIGVAAGERRRIRVDYVELTGNASLQLQWSLNSGAFVNIPDSALTPGYNLTTSSVSAGSAAKPA